MTQTSTCKDKKKVELTKLHPTRKRCDDTAPVIIHYSWNKSIPSRGRSKASFFCAGWERYAQKRAGFEHGGELLQKMQQLGGTCSNFARVPAVQVFWRLSQYWDKLNIFVRSRKCSGAVFYGTRCGSGGLSQFRPKLSQFRRLYTKVYTEFIRRLCYCFVTALLPGKLRLCYLGSSA